MRLFLLAALSVIHAGTHAQKLKTIFTNEKDAVALFFPSTIRQALTGSENFTFSYNREDPQHVGIVQGIGGKGSNLLVITGNGDVYSYRLAYRKVLDTLNHFVAGTERIGNAAPAMVFTEVDSLTESVTTMDPDLGRADTLMRRREYFKKFGPSRLKLNDGSLKKKRKQGLILRLKDLVYDRTEVYAVLEIGNRSGIDFEVDYLKVFKVNGNNRRKASYQKLPLEILHKEDFPHKVEDGDSDSFVVVLPKFTLGDTEKLGFELNESNGSRNLRLLYK